MHDWELGDLPWQGNTVVCVAGGPSAKEADLGLVKGKARVIVINESWRLAPWADMLYACDPKWWQLRAPKSDEFKGIRVTQDLPLALELKIKRVGLSHGKNEILIETPGLLGWGHNSGFHALNLAIQAKARRVILVGYDMSVAKGVHWHGRHENLSNPDKRAVERWRLILDEQASLIRSLGVKVLNTSKDSALTAYPKVPLAEALYV